MDKKVHVQSLERIFQIDIVELEVVLLALAPGTFPIKVNVCALFKIICYLIRLRVSLEPGQILLVKSPTLFFQFTCSEVSKRRVKILHRNKLIPTVGKCLACSKRYRRACLFPIAKISSIARGPS